MVNLETRYQSARTQAFQWLAQDSRKQSDLARLIGVRPDQLSRFLNEAEVHYKPTAARPKMLFVLEGIERVCSPQNRIWDVRRLYPIGDNDFEGEWVESIRNQVREITELGDPSAGLTLAGALVAQCSHIPPAQRARCCRNVQLAIASQIDKSGPLSPEMVERTVKMTRSLLAAAEMARDEEGDQEGLWRDEVNYAGYSLYFCGSRLRSTMLAKEGLDLLARSLELPGPQNWQDGIRANFGECLLKFLQVSPRQGKDWVRRNAVTVRQLIESDEVHATQQHTLKKLVGAMAMILVAVVLAVASVGLSVAAEPARDNSGRIVGGASESVEGKVRAMLDRERLKGFDEYAVTGTIKSPSARAVRGDRVWSVESADRYANLLPQDPQSGLGRRLQLIDQNLNELSQKSQAALSTLAEPYQTPLFDVEQTGDMRYLKETAPRPQRIKHADHRPLIYFIQ